MERWKGPTLTRRRFVAALGATALSCTTATPSPSATASVTSAPTTAIRQTSAPTPARFDVKAFGAVGDGKADDAKAIAAAIKAATEAGAGATVFFPKGRYALATTTRLTAKQRYPAAQGIGDTALQTDALVALQDVRDLTLAGEEGAVLFARHSNSAVIGLSGCRNVTIRSLGIDYEQIWFTQGTVAAVSEAANILDLAVQTGYPDPTSPLFANARTWLTVRPAATPLVMRTNTPNQGQVFFSDLANLRPVASGLFRITGVTRNNLAGVVAGDRFVFGARDNAHPGTVTAWFCDGCTFEKVAIWGAPVLAYSLFYDDALTFRECVVEPLPGTDRLLSTNADAIHCKWSRTGPRIEGCRFSGMHDDAFTIHGSGTRVLSAQGNALTVERFEFFRPGDEVAIIDSAAGRPRGTAKVADAGLIRWRDQVAVRLTLDAPVTGTTSYEAMYAQASLSPRLDQVTPPDRRPDLVADLAALGSGFVVRGNTFARHQGASRIYAWNGLVEDNRFESVSRHGLQLGMELYWPEVYSARSVVVRRNTFAGATGEVTIRVQDRLGLLSRPGTGLGNRDLEFTENRFEGYGADGALFVSNAENVRIAGNDFGAGATDVPVALDLCRTVTVDSAKPIKVSTTSATDPATLTLKGQVTTVRK